MTSDKKIYGAPTIAFSEGRVVISGRSILLEPTVIYNQLLVDFHHYLSHPKEKTEIHIALDCTNSASNRQLLNVLILAEKLFSQGRKVDVYWYYQLNDELVYEQGTLFNELLELPFHYIQMNADMNLSA